MVLFGSLLDQFVSVFARVNVLSTFEFDAVRFNGVIFLSMDFMHWDTYFVFNPKDSRSKIYVEVYDGVVPILNLETRCSSSATSQIQWRQCCSSSEISSEDQVC